MHRATMDPAEAVAHLVAHDVRAPIFLAAELLRMTVEDGDGDDEPGGVNERLRAVIDGLTSAGQMCDDVVTSLRPTPTTQPPVSLVDLVGGIWPDTDVTISGPGNGDGLIHHVLQDLADVVPSPRSVTVDLGSPVRCEVRAAGIDDHRDACLALARAARRVRPLELAGGDFRVGRDGNEFVIDVRFPQGVDGR